MCCSLLVMGLNNPPLSHACTLICLNTLACTSTNGVNRAFRGSVTAGSVALITSNIDLRPGFHNHVTVNEIILRINPHTNESRNPNMNTRIL